MKKIALLLLWVFFILFIISVYFELHFLKAISEAALIWWIADRFAIVALFRHPLWLKIPHTALIGKQKNNIGKNLWKFIKSEFLQKDHLEKAFWEINFTKNISKYFQNDASAKKIASLLKDGIYASPLPPMALMMLQSINIDELLEGIIKNIGKRIPENPSNIDINSFIKEEIIQFILSHSEDIEKFISQRVENWDTQDLIKKVEWEIGKDLQFIRINGTLVGAFLWGLFYVVSYGIGYF